MAHQATEETWEKVGKDGVIEIGEQLAKEVFRGRFDDHDVAVKRVNMFEVNKNYYNIKELKYLRKFDHKNVVKYHYKDSDKHFLYIALEWCDETLEEFTTAEQRKDDLHHLQVLWQISKGMAYLHEKKLVHRDLKPSNILMKHQDGNWVAKITDFGISKTLPPGRTKITQSGVSGTEGYMAPEQMAGDKIGKHTDIYSLGLIFHYVLSGGKHVFGCKTSEITRKMWDEDAKPDLDAIKDEFKHDAESLILSMIARKPEKRLCIKDVQAHHLFWTSRKKLAFFAEVSDYIISPDERFKTLQPIFEAKQEEIAANWRQAIREASAIVGKEMDNMKNRRQGDGICDLLRNIRNVKHHYEEKTEEFREAIGGIPDGMYKFFEGLFPKLLNHVHEIMRDSKANARFVEYYTFKEHDEYLRQKPSNQAGTPIPSENVFAQATASEEAAVPDETVNSFASVMNESNTTSEVAQHEMQNLVSSDKSPTSSSSHEDGNGATEAPMCNEKSALEAAAAGTDVTREIEVMDVDMQEDKLATQQAHGDNSIVAIVAPTTSETESSKVSPTKISTIGTEIPSSVVSKTSASTVPTAITDKPASETESSKVSRTKISTIGAEIPASVVSKASASTVPTAITDKPGSDVFVDNEGVKMIMQPKATLHTGVTQEFRVMAVGKQEICPNGEGAAADSGKVDTLSATAVGDIPALDGQITDIDGSAKMNVSEKKPTSSSKPEVMAVDKQDKLMLRDYQWELAQQALKGENSLIVAPTGSGKTAVLTEVIRQHLETHQDNGRVMFMVPKTALARQQYWYLKRCLEGCSIDYMIGQFAESAPVGQRILANQVTVLTPQILINELKKDSDRRYVSFTDLTMFVFDECHNATKNHPYRELMDMLLDLKSTEPDHQIQVVGVTASPGVGKAKDRIKVREKLIELLGNLNVMAAPSTVEKYVEELARHHSKVKEYFLQIETEKQFASEVEIVVGDIENTISRKLKENQIESAILGNAPLDKSSQTYGKWIEDFKEIVCTDTMQDGEMSRRLLSYANNLKLYHYLLQLKDLIPNAIYQARKKVPISTEGPEWADLKIKYESLKEKATTIQTPMFDTLLNILKEDFAHNPDARCIVFVEWKITAECLNDCISKSDKLNDVKSNYMTGTTGMSDTQQSDILNAFKRGDFKILVATSVAEEGLSIDDCSIVIMYNYVTGEVGRLQRHGRGRADTCKAVILATAQGDHKKREEDNKSRAVATKIAIEDIKKLDAIDLRNRILNAQMKHKNERARKRKALKGKSGEDCRNGEPPSKWQILCGSCKNPLTTGDKLRHIDDMHTVVKDKEFFSRTKRKNVRKDKASNVVGLADYHCVRSTCGEKVALGMDYENKLHPILSVKKIVVKNDEGIIKNPKRRKNLPFKIDKSVDECEDGEEDVFETIDRTQVPEESTEASLNSEDCYEFLNLMRSKSN